MWRVECTKRVRNWVSNIWFHINVIECEHEAFGEWVEFTQELLYLWCGLKSSTYAFFSNGEVYGIAFDAVEISKREASYDWHCYQESGESSTQETFACNMRWKKLSLVMLPLFKKV